MNEKNLKKKQRKTFELKELLKSLRIILSECCSRYLNADLFILDEFQRYSKLLQTENQDNPGIELARQVLNKEDTKVLLLSATPFKPYTNDFDELHGESHYNEFRQLLKFLLQEKDEEFWNKYENDRKVFFNSIRRSKELRLNFTEAKLAKSSLENIYRSCIARTERMLVSEQKDAMISSPSFKLFGFNCSFITTNRLKNKYFYISFKNNYFYLR